jgi:hypothetical protein
MKDNFFKKRILDSHSLVLLSVCELVCKQVCWISLTFSH